MTKIAGIASNLLGIICCAGMFYLYGDLISIVFNIFFSDDTGAVAIIGGDPDESALSFFQPFQPLFFVILCAIVFSINLYVLTRKGRH